MATKGEQSRQRILEASRSIILESGIGKLSHGAIAEVLDISKSAIHWHFPTKDDLLKALIDDYLEHLQAEEKRHETPFIASVPRTPCCPPCASGIWTSGRTAPAGSDSARSF